MATLSAALGKIQQRRPSASTLPVRAVIFDSSPGDSNWTSATLAFTAGINNAILKTTIRLTLYVVFSLAWIYLCIIHRGQYLDILYDQLLGPGIIPTSASWLYIYSATDRLISAAAVEAHAKAAKNLGMNVMVEKYDNTPHVNHVRGDPERYWKAVTKTWERANR